MRSAVIILRNLLATAMLVLTTTVASGSTVSFISAASSVDRGGVYSGFYALQLDSLAIAGMCDARYSHVGPGMTWTADIRTFTDIQGGAAGKFNSPSTPATLAKYGQAGWLFSQISALAANDYEGQADIQEAIWKIMAPGYGLVGSGAVAWYTAATGGAHDAFDWSGVMRVVTPNPPVQDSIDIQEFLVAPGITVVPVPGAAWLFGSGIGLLAVGRRRAS